jgi:LysM repeat protein
MPKRAFATLLATGAAAAVAVVGFGGSGSTAGLYTVQPGDTLWALAQSHHTTVASLAVANHMLPTDLLLAGRVITIPNGGADTDGDNDSGGAVTAAGTAVSSAGGTALDGASGTAYGSVPPASFCATYRPWQDPWGVLPAQLADEPSLLAIRPYFVTWGEHYGVSPALLEAIAWQESGWQIGVVSAAGAVGIGQIMPATAEFVDTQLVGQSLRINAVSDNIRMEASFVAYLEGQAGSTCNTVAAYYEGLKLLHEDGVIPETQQYVANVLALMPRFE